MFLYVCKAKATDYVIAAYGGQFISPEKEIVSRSRDNLTVADSNYPDIIGRMYGAAFEAFYKPNISFMFRLEQFTIKKEYQENLTASFKRNFNIKARVQTIQLTVYVLKSEFLQIYAGLGFGKGTGEALVNQMLYYYDSAFIFIGSAGLVLKLGPVGLFAEGQYRFNNFKGEPPATHEVVKFDLGGPAYVGGVKIYF